ncbi:MAG TPA: heme ABC exporter ATP-binding protein CcmA [Stellaceae bacterium]|nr:heme ABC exporter ATP-binding protein CcmA [Stellaceae bacterium]
MAATDLTGPQRHPAGVAAGVAAGALVAEDLACRRGARLVFAGVSFVVPPGGALVVRGANGAGKSSLLRLVAGLVAPAAGRLVWGSQPLAADPAGHRARLHYVGHQDAVKPGMTARDTLAFWAALRGHGRGISLAIADALASLALDPVADWPCRWLSAGQRRRLALARLLVAPAELWLLDEPTTALDEDGRMRLETMIEAHRAGGGRVLLATHLPLALHGAATLHLDRFAPLEDPAAETWT